MKFQRKTSDGGWEEEDRVAQFVKKALGQEPRMSKFDKRTPLTTDAEVMAYLATGATLRYDTEWYAEIRDADAQPKRVVAPVEMRRCACGHSVAARLVMSTSSGTACPDCYDRMSD